MMAQMLSTFSKLEQSRFEAFQRASFPADAMGKWIAACLSHRFRVYAETSASPPTTTTRATSVAAATSNNNAIIHNSSTSRPLSDLVAVGQEGEICMVVGVLAKIYAQRLVQTAIRQRAAAAAAAAATASSNPSIVSVPSQQQPQQQPQALLPSDILKAHEERRRLGLDPGFFLQAAQERQGLWQSDNAAISSSSNTMHQQRRLAALQAQDEYDALHVKTTAAMNDEAKATENQPEEEEEGDGNDDDNEQKKNDNDMVID
jgi:hypothetical protein